MIRLRERILAPGVADRAAAGRTKCRVERMLRCCCGCTVPNRSPAGRLPAVSAWPFETAREPDAIRIWPVVFANGRFRCRHQGCGRGDAARSHGADLSERFWIDCRSHDQRVHRQLEPTQAVPVVRKKRNDDTWRVCPASWFLMDL
jgi:hypothetical protein